MKGNYSHQGTKAPRITKKKKFPIIKPLVYLSVFVSWWLKKDS